MPPWVTLLGSVLFLVFCFVLIFFVARSCVAAQEATQIRKYVTSADSTLSDSANVGNEDLQPTLDDPANLDAAAIDRAADATQRGYLEALRSEEVPVEFEDAHHYMVTALGIRAAATGEIAEAAEGDSEAFEEALSSAVEDYRLSDTVVFNHYIPASEEALREAGRRSDQNYLHEPRPFMDYEALDLSTSATTETSTGDTSSPTTNDPSTPRDLTVSSVAVAGRPLYPGADVLLTGSDELIFAINVSNNGNVAETGVPVEVVLNTRAERQALPATIERIEPNGQATAEVRGFKPGEFDETAEVNIKAGPVRYEQNEQDNVLTGTVTFGL